MGTITKVEVILNTLTLNLDEIHSQEVNIILIAKKGLQCIKDALVDLHLLLSKHKFENPQEEVYFLKKFKTVLYSKLFYYSDLLNIEARRPIGSEKFIKRYFRKELNKLTEHFYNNKSTYIYYRTESENFDNIYFSKIKMYEEKYDRYGDIIICEDDYSSRYDMLWAGIIANSQLESYLNSELNKLKNGYVYNTTAALNSKAAKDTKMTWTNTKSSCIELVYALVHSGSINNGKVNIKDVVILFEAMFQVNLGNPHKEYSELKLRDKRTKFLDMLKKSLLFKMDNDNEKRYL